MSKCFVTLMGAVLAVGLSACMSQGDEERTSVAVQQIECDPYPSYSDSGEYLGVSITIEDRTDYYGPDDMSQGDAARLCDLVSGGTVTTPKVPSGEEDQDEDEEEDEGEGGE